MIEILKQMVEALVEASGHVNNEVFTKVMMARDVGNQAIADLEKQKPVVWMYQDKSTHEVRFQKNMRDFVDHSQTSEIPLYSEPLANHELQCVCGAVWCGDEMVHLPNKTFPPQPLQQEPVAWARFSEKGNLLDLLSEPDDGYTPLYTSPPQRKPLTDDEADELVNRFARYELLRAVEQKHGIKE
jgi:hypothetical protein